MFGLANILKPLSIDEFLFTYKGSRAVYIEGPSDKFRGLYDWEDVNHVINKSRLSYEGIGLVHETNTLPVQEIANMSSWLAKGATLIVNHTQHIDPVIEQFSETLADDMNTNVNVNCYVSFPSKQGFDCHYDTHDVFVIQTCGTKSWKLFNPTRLHPLDRDPDTEKRAQKKERPQIEDQDSYLECTLTPGDVLYIPRGHWHYAISETPSVHLTCSYNNRSGIDFLAWLLNDLRMNDEFFREDFPLCQVNSLLGERSDKDLGQHLNRFRKRLVDTVNDDKLMEQLLAWVQVENPVRKQVQLPELAELDQSPVGPDVPFRIATHQKFLPRIDEDHEVIHLLGKGQVVRLKRVPKALVEYLLTAPETFTGAELRNTSPKTPWENIQRMLQQLYVAGLIVRADAPSPE